ncbi:MAG: hypothetical protein QHH15_02985 [Candidatus Thermoplasmatota archaeon]|jgi:hypothetical protein|nr:hypothetical protein [Candidatus Thermoplasmatota archaeon]
MNKKKTTIVLSLMLLLLAVTFLSGCVGPRAISTWGWEHINDEGTAVRLWGHLTISENFQNWKAWFVYDTESHSNWENYAYRVEADSYHDFNYFSVDIYNLSRPTTYHYRAVGEYQGQGNVIRVGDDLTFIPGGPRVVTINASNIQITSVQFNGRLTHMGGASSCEVFFRYGENQNYLNMETPHQILTSIADFNAEVTDLTSCKTYYYQAIAINDVDTWVGLILEVAPGKPIVDTYLPVNVTKNSGLFKGTLWKLGGPSSCEVWFEYGDVNPNNLNQTTPHLIVNTTGPFEINVEGLKSGTTYWVRAVADNGVCDDKGGIKEFKTLSSLKEYETLKNNNQQMSLKQKILSLIEREFGNTDPYTIQMLQKQYPVLSKLLE